MLRSYFAVSLIAAVLVLSASAGIADTYTGTFANTSAKQWIAWHVECPGKNSTPDIGSAVIYNTAMPSQRWLTYQFEQGTNYYQNNGFLAYPPEGANAQIDPGETLSVRFDYTLNTAPASFTQYGVAWPPGGTMVTITPQNMQDWSIATNRGATAGLVTYGCAIYEANRGLITECENIHLGRGTFYTTLDYSGGPGTSGDAAQSSTAWLGTDTHNNQPLAGVTLNRITTMKYFGFVSKEPTRTTGAHWDNWQQYWIGPRQPICLELTAENPSDPADRRQFWFRPWQTAKVSGDNCGRQARRWLWYDCINGTPQVQVTRRWYCYRGLDEQGNSLDEVFASWAELIAQYGTWKLVATSNNPWPAGYKSAGWDNTTSPNGSPTCTATGKCLNFQVGARKGDAIIYCVENTTPVNWAGNYWGFRGHVDFFTLGIDGVDVTYDFEPSPTEPTPKVVSINQKIADDAIMGKMVVGYNNYASKQYSHALDYYPVRITGKVVEKSTVYFVLDDGSKQAMPTRVYLVRDNHVRYDSASGYGWPGLGQWWTVYGFLEKTRFKVDEARPWILWASYFNLKRIN